MNQHYDEDIIKTIKAKTIKTGGLSLFQLSDSFQTVSAGQSREI